MNQDLMNSLTSFLPIVAILVVFIILIIIPQRKRDKQAKEMLASMKVGSKIKTIGGIYGTIVVLKDDLVTIETGPDKCKIVFAKGAIASVDNNPDIEIEAPTKTTK